MTELSGRITRICSKKKMAAGLGFVTLHLNEAQDFWNNVLWKDIYPQCTAPGLAKMKLRILPQTPQTNLSMVVEEWWPGHPEVIDSTVNSFVNQKILKPNMKPPVWQLKTGPYQVMMHQNNDVKHSCKSTTERLKMNRKGSVQVQIRPSGSRAETNVCKTQQTQATLKRRVGQNSSTTIRDWKSQILNNHFTKSGSTSSWFRSWAYRSFSHNF